MKKIVIILIYSTIIYFGGSTYANSTTWPMTGNDYLAYNEAEKTYFIMGFVYGITVYYNSIGCDVIPPGVTVGQIKDIVTNFIVKNPGKRHLNLSFLAAIGIDSVFPVSSCKKK